MNLDLTDIEVRALGSLIEKEITTPEYYPLTLNSLTAACNQKSNRDPVMTLDTQAILPALDSLKARHLVWHVTGGGRTTKYDHNLRNVITLSPQEIAVLCVLMLRGAQTPGELRGRTERMCKFESMEQVQQTLGALTQHEEGPLVTELPRQPGQKESRYTHLLSGQPRHASAEPVVPLTVAPVQPEPVEAHPRQASLEDEVKEIRRELDELKAAFEDFRKQLE